MPSNPKNTRRCCVCREHADKSELIRLALTSDGVKIDHDGNMSGRGAYVHKSATCIEACIKKLSLNGAFKHAVAKEIYDELKNQL